jgi:hypothetical protein
MKKLLLLLPILMFTAFACDTEADLQQEETNSSVAMRASSQIPFTVSNMKKAHVNILEYYRLKGEADVVAKYKNYVVNTTHYYYKFSPADSLQHAALIKDTLIDVSVTPFEEEYKEPATDYPDDHMPQFYAVVAAGQKLPTGVPVEILEEFHFTNEDALDETKDYVEVEFLLNLTYEARKIVGHLDKDEINDGYFNLEPLAQRGWFSNKWRPSGRLRVEEDRLTTLNGNNKFFVPIRGARVNMLKWGWLQVEHGYTDINGNFSGGTTHTKWITYNVKFKHSFSIIREGNFFDTANHRSSNMKKTAWVHDFTTGGRSHFYALVYNASYDYYYRVLGLFGLHFPGSSTISAKYHGTGSENVPGWVPFASDIKIARLNDNGTYRNSDGIYASTVHELTHKSHRSMDPGMFSIIHNGNNQRKLMKESWAEGAETIITNQRYNMIFTGYTGSNSIGFTPNGWNGSKQAESAASMDEYTPLVIDLNDAVNQNNNYPQAPVDRVSGYTLSQMQSALNNSTTLNQWRDKLVNNYNNPTEGNINDAFIYANLAIPNAD